MDNLFGIDFGSAYSRGAFWNAGGQPEVLRDKSHLDSTALLPSAVFVQDGKTQVGWPARRKKSEATSLKRRWMDGDAEASRSVSLVLNEVRTLTENLTQMSSPSAVFSVPASMGSNRQQFEQMAGAAGFKVLGCLPESTAAALSYAYLKKKNGLIGVFNFGGGFFEFAVVSIESQKVRLLGAECLAMGGEDLDLGVAQNILKEMGPAWKDFAARNPEFYQRVLEEAEKTRCALSHRGSCDLQFEDGAVPQKFARAFSRFELAKWVRESVEKTIAVCESAMKKAGVTHADIQEVLLSGGVTRMPYVQEIVEKIFRKKGNMEINPDLAVVYGTLIEASIRSGRISGWSVEIAQ
jgi:molecular chaperone DnaK